jgi:hypothetical protein
MMTVTITLKVAHEHADKDAVILKLARVYAKQLITQATLIKDRTPPQISIMAGDFYTAETEVLLYDDSGTEMDSEATAVLDRFDPNIRRSLKQVHVNLPKKPTETDDD